ncbi:hypothetical protein [Streptomyces lydicamycinicus]|uniref:hypothetical protein n=1 Tax=Streptomyces lydicamycinicus TaxID=1546107 RepID=UPI003C2BECA5
MVGHLQWSGTSSGQVAGAAELGEGGGGDQGKQVFAQDLRRVHRVVAPGRHQ